MQAAMFGLVVEAARHWLRRADDADEDDSRACLGTVDMILSFAGLTWSAVLEEPIERPGS